VSSLTWFRKPPARLLALLAASALVLGPAPTATVQGASATGPPGAPGNPTTDVGTGSTPATAPGAAAAAAVELHLGVEPGRIVVTLEFPAEFPALPAGPVVFERPGSEAPTGVELTEAELTEAKLTAVELTAADGTEAAVGVDGWSVSADLPTCGPWCLRYAVGFSPPPDSTPSGDGLAEAVLLRPADFVLLPAAPPAWGSGSPAPPPAPDRQPIRLSVTAPDGWCVLPNAAAALGRALPLKVLGRLLVLAAPEPPPVLDSVETGTSTLVVRDLGGASGASSQARSCTAARAALTLLSRLLRKTLPDAVNVFADARSSAADVAGATLDAAWLQLAASSPAAASDTTDTTDILFLDQGVWPLARHALLLQAGQALGLGLVGEADLAAALVAESQSYREAPTACPAEGAPLCSAYLIARAAELGPEELLSRALSTACDRPTGLVAALAPPELAVRLTTGTRLPDLPADLLALADPDTDQDGLPDRLDPEPLVKGVSVVVDGRLVRWDVPPVVRDGRIMVPLRALAESLGLEVSWDEAAQKVLVARAETRAEFPIGCPWYTLAGRMYLTDAPALVLGGRVLVPLRYAAEALNVFLAWDQATLTATLDSRRPYEGPGAPEGTGRDGGSGGQGPSGESGGREPDVETHVRTAYLTFDDGPNPAMTPRVLEVLADKKVRATFFVIGRQAQRYPDLLRRIVSEGHALGNHTFSHDLDRTSPGWVYRSPQAYVDELEACDKVIAAATGLHPAATRPPGGSYPYLTREFKDALAAAGFRTYDWDVSAADSAVPRPTAAQIIARIKETAGSKGRTRLIILMHDGGDDHETTLQALPAVIDLLRALGYGFDILR